MIKRHYRNEKIFLWLKIQGNNKRLVENNCSFSDRLIMSFCYVTLIFLLFVLLYGLGLYRYNFYNETYLISGCFTTVGLLVSGAMVISLVDKLQRMEKLVDKSREKHYSFNRH